MRHVFSEVRKGVGNPSLSYRALGMAVRRAFPTVVRRKIGAVYCYCGLQVTPHSNRALSTGSCTSTNNVTSQVRNNTSTNCIPNKDAASRIKIKKEIKRSSTGSYEQHREHYITSININLSELHRTDNDPILGEGTFAKCILGTYKIIQVAIKFFKGQPFWKTVHNEANIMMKIPGHPGIPMFMGLFTLHYSYLLVTKFHYSDDSSNRNSSSLSREQSARFASDVSCFKHPSLL